MASSAAETAALPDGVYTAEFDTDSSMFHANEAVDGMGTLTVENGTMTFHAQSAVPEDRQPVSGHGRRRPRPRERLAAAYR